MKHLLPSVAVALCALALSGCGSSDDHDAGGGGTTVATSCSSGIPDSALANAAGLVGYAKQLVGMNSDTSEPLVTCNAALPTDDTAEPSN